MERIHAVQLFYPDGKMHRMPRRQAWMPAENERKAIALAWQSNKSLRLDYILLNASTIFSRMASTDGIVPAAMPATSVKAIPLSIF